MRDRPSAGHASGDIAAEQERAGLDDEGPEAGPEPAVDVDGSVGDAESESDADARFDHGNGCECGGAPGSEPPGDRRDQRKRRDAQHVPGLDLKRRLDDVARVAPSWLGMNVSRLALVRARQTVVVNVSSGLVATDVARSIFDGRVGALSVSRGVVCLVIDAEVRVISS